MMVEEGIDFGRPFVSLTPVFHLTKYILYLIGRNFKLNTVVVPVRNAQICCFHIAICVKAWS